MNSQIRSELSNLHNELMTYKLSAAKKEYITNSIHKIQSQLLSDSCFSPNAGSRRYQQQVQFPNPGSPIMGPRSIPNMDPRYHQQPMMLPNPNMSNPIGISPTSPNTTGVGTSTFMQIPPMRPQDPIQIPLPGNHRLRTRNVVVENEAIISSIDLHKSKLNFAITNDEEEKVRNDVFKIIGSRDGMANFDSCYRDEIAAKQTTGKTDLFYLFTKMAAITTVMTLVSNRYEIDGFPNSCPELSLELGELHRVFCNLNPSIMSKN